MIIILTVGENMEKFFISYLTQRRVIDIRLIQILKYARSKSYISR